MLLIQITLCQIYFYPRPPRGGRRGGVRLKDPGGVFLSTPSARRATPSARPQACRPTYFYPRPPRGGRLGIGGQLSEEEQFLSTPSARRATCAPVLSRELAHISIHALREEGDSRSSALNLSEMLFLSTPSARRATKSWRHWTSCSRNFYPRPPRGGRRGSRRCTCPSPRISIHALREEGDSSRLMCSPSTSYFYPRPPRGGRLHFAPDARPPKNFYPRPPRGGRRKPKGEPTHEHYFYPRPPRGGRLTQAGTVSRFARFLSTPSARRATRKCEAQHIRTPYFYPRPPRGGRQQKQRQKLYFQTNYTTFCTNLEEP